jgi:hypothetical protein
MRRARAGCVARRAARAVTGPGSHRNRGRAAVVAALVGCAGWALGRLSGYVDGFGDGRRFELEEQIHDEFMRSLL